MDSAQGKSVTFNRTGDVRSFITKAELYSSLKNYTGEKCAQALASKLEGPAFDVYLRLSSEDRKDANKITAELLKEFERGRRDREEALSELSKCKREVGESAQNFAYKILELVKLAYPTFESKTQETISRDYFVNGLHVDMQVALKSLQAFENKTLNELADETTRLELAGIQSLSVNKRFSANSVNPISEEDIVESIAVKVIAKLQTTSLSCHGGAPNEEVKSVSASYNHGCGHGWGAQNHGMTCGNKYHGFQGPVAAKTPGKLRCRTYQSEEHLYRACPLRFCQACGKRGHDAWDSSCANYQ